MPFQPVWLFTLFLWYEARLETKPLHNDAKRPSEKYSDGLFKVGA